LTSADHRGYLALVRALVVWNPSAGRGRTGELARSVSERLATAGVASELHRTTSLDDARAAARRSASGTDAVLALGGDGTVGACAAGLADAAEAGAISAALGVLPAGSGNDAAAAFGLPLGDPVVVAGLVPALARRRIDMVKATGPGRPDAWWLNVAGAGFDAEVNRLANKVPLPGRTKYVSAVLARLPRERPARFELELDGRAMTVDAWFVACANGPSYGGGMRIGPGARMDDGRLDVVVIGALSRTAFLRTFPKVFKGLHVAHPAVQVHRASTVTMATDRPTLAYADGEFLGHLPATWTVRPGLISVLAAPGAPGLSPEQVVHRSDDGTGAEAGPA
jgi:diacylglycerol kinase (ATP)